MSIPIIEYTVDSNEKYPLLFPDTIWMSDLRGERQLYQLVKKKARLNVADISLVGDETLAGVECKRSIDELRHNFFTKDKRRANEAFCRFAQATKYRYLLLDMTLGDFYKKSANLEWPDVVQDKFMQTMDRLNIQLLWLPCPGTASGRRQVGEFVIRKLFNCRLEEQRRIMNVGL